MNCVIHDKHLGYAFCMNNECKGQRFICEDCCNDQHFEHEKIKVGPLL